jgi:putative protease
VAIIELSDGLAVGDRIKIKGATSDLEQDVDSMQIEREQIKEAKKGDAIGLKVAEKVREGDEVYKVL